MPGPVIHVVQHLAPGGLEVMALELARAQAAARPGVAPGGGPGDGPGGGPGGGALVLSLEGSAAEAEARWPRLAAERGRLIFLGKRPGVDPALPLRLGRLFRRLRPDCVHTHHIGPLLYAGAAARAAGVRARLHTEHDAWHLAVPRRRRVMRAALALARPILVADAPDVAERVQEAIGGATPPRVVMNGVDTARFVPGDRAAARAALGLPADRPVIGVAARLERVKGVDLAIEALRLLPRSDAVLAIAGTGSEEAMLRLQAMEAGLAQRVRFLGLIGDMAGFYPALDLLCVPSRAEGLPLAPLEAQACGVRVVGTRVGAVAAALCPMTGRLVAPGEAAALARALAGALEAPCAGDPRPFVLREASLATAAQAYLDLAFGPAAGRA